MEKIIVVGLLVITFFAFPVIAMEKPSPRFDRLGLIAEVQHLNTSLQQLISSHGISHPSHKSIVRSNSRRSLCETKDEICGSVVGAGTRSTQEAQKILEKKDDSHKEQQALDLYLTAFNMYVKAYYKNSTSEVLEPIPDIVSGIIAIAQKHDAQEISGAYLNQKLLLLKSQITFLINQEKDKHARRTSEPQFDRISSKLTDAQNILKKLRRETEDTQQEIKSTAEPLLKIAAIKETNLERIRTCYSVLASLFLIYHEINQSEEAYKAMEDALDLLLINNIQISQITAHEWNDEPKFKNTLALIRKIRAELDEKAVKAKQRAAQLKQQTSALAQGQAAHESNLLTWEQALVESMHAAPAQEKADCDAVQTHQNAEATHPSKPSIKQKILDKLLLKKH